MYYYNMTLSIPKESNCSFSANIWTDIMAFIAGFVLVAIGIYCKEYEYKHWFSLVTFTIGLVIIVEHIWQLVHNKI